MSGLVGVGAELLAGMRLYLGTHEPAWLARTSSPLFVSRRTLAGRRSYPRAVCDWALDSGGYTELSRGGWSISPLQYAAEVLRYQREIGRLRWAAPMDWMCEAGVLAATGLDVAEHQRRTLRNFAQLRETLGALIVPVVQGWRLDDYLRHVEAYTAAGYELEAEPLVAVGSVCRRGQDDEVVRILDRLARERLSLHAFGVRSRAMERVADALVSADSMAWSLDARRAAGRGELPDHPHDRGGLTCANCLVYADRWYANQCVRLQAGRLEVAV